MKKIKFFLSFFYLLIASVAIGQIPFKSGNIVVVRLGDGNASYADVSAPIFLDEYTISGSLVQSVSLPTADNGANLKICLPYSKGNMGLLSLSPDGQYLTITGFNSNTGVNVPDLFLGTVNRTIARIDYNGAINTTTSIPGSEVGNGPSPIGVVTQDGNNFWSTHDGFGAGLRYSTLGQSTSVQIVNANNQRGPYIYNNQLFVGVASGAVSISGGLPVTGPQTFSFFSGMPLAVASSTQLFFADLNPAIAGFDVAYIASNGDLALSKYSLVGTDWVLNGTIGINADDYRGLAGIVNGTSVTLYSTRIIPDVSNNGGSELVTITDNTGYSSEPNTFVGTPAIIKIAGANTSFRGVAMVPQPLSVSLSTKAFLYGAYSSTLGRHKNVTTTWAGVLNASALNQPYNAAPFNYAGTESVSAGFFTADDGVTTDIVDWVLVELHDATTPSTIIARKACFIREDGQIVDLDKVSNPSFTGVGANNYYVVIKHRNHLPIRSATTVFVNGATPVLYDFTTAQSQAFQNGAVTSNAAMKDFSGVFCMWGGNVNANNNTKYTGPQNDALALLALLGANQAAILSNVYSGGDVNMDGTVRYTGPNNDALALLAVLSANQAAVINEHQ
jgi:hypothetical protein